MGNQITVTVLDGVGVQVDGRSADVGGRRQRRLLAAFTVEPSVTKGADHLIDRVWSDGDLPDDPRRTLRTYLTRLRRTLGDADALVTVDDGWHLDTAIIELDTLQLASRAEQASDPGLDAHQRLRALDGALALYASQPYGELADEPWLRGEVERLEELRITLRERRYDAMLDAGKHTDAIPGLAAAIEAHPLRDRLVGLQMLALFRTGRQADASRAFQEHRRRLAEELGLEPGTELIELDRQILAGDDSLHLDRPPGQPLRSYRLGEQLGEGAFAMVYRGTQPSLGRDVAVKVIRAGLANRPEFIRRFEAEAHLVARLEHPRVVPLYDYWREPDRACLVFRYLRGGTLEAQLTRTGHLDLDTARRLADHVGAALTAAHEVGVVHRDVKPANVFLDEGGNYYLGDFGIALEDAELSDPTAALSAGSPAYAAPEQLRREPIGPTADVHGLGISLYEALTAQLPFPAAVNQADLLQRQLNEPIPAVRSIRADVPTGVDEVLARATAKDPTARFQTVAELVDAFAAAVDGDGAPPREQTHRRGSTTAVSGGDNRNPYKGLRAFTEADAGDFKGRERLVDRIVELMGREDSTGRITAIVGPSGIGKSSVIRAGLLPALRQGVLPESDQWFIATMLPGTDPFEELAAALLRVASRMPDDLMDTLSADHRGLARVVKVLVPEDSGAEILLVLDQFEELFTLVTDEQVRRRFLDSLEHAVTDARCPFRVVLTVRADFWDRPLRHGSFARLIEHSTVQVTALAPDEVERAIVDPALSVGCEFEPGLVSEIVADITDEPGALPLFQYSLTELWERRVSGLLTREAYAALGGVPGAVARRAEDLYDGATTEEQIAVQQVFERLVTLGEGADDTRRRAIRSELGQTPAIDAVIRRYGDARLLSFDRDPGTREPTVEVAHEALLREWPRLRGWLDDNRDELRALRHLTDASAEWDAGGHDEADLYRGGRLEAAEELATARAGQLSETERRFLDQSLDQRRQERSTEEARYHQQVRANRRLRQLLTGVAVLLAVAVVAGALAFDQRGRAQDSETLAEERAADALAREAEAVTAREGERTARAASETRRMIADAAVLAETDPQLALLLAAEAYNRLPDAESLGGLQRVLTGTGRFLGFVTTDGSIQQLAYAADGSLLAASTQGLLRFEPDGTATALADLGTDSGSGSGSGSDDGSGIDLLLPDLGQYTVADGAITEIRSVDDHALTATIEHREPPARVAVAGTTLVALLDGGWIETWDVTTGERLALIHAVPESTLGELDPQIPPEARTPSFQNIPVTTEKMPIALNQDGSVVAVGGTQFIRFFTTATGERWRDDLLVRFDLGDGVLHTSVAYADLGFADDDSAIYGASGVFRFVFDVASGGFLTVRQSENFIGQNPTVAFAQGVELRRSGEVVFNRPVGAMAEGTSFTTPMANGSAVAIAADGQQLAIASADGVALFALDDAGLLRDAIPRHQAASFSINAAGDRALLDYFYFQPYTYEYRRGPDGQWAETRHDFDLGTSAWISDQVEPGWSEYDVVSGADGRTRIVDPTTRAILGELPNSGAGALIAESELALGLDDGTVIVFDLPSGGEHRVLDDLVEWADVEAAAATNTPPLESLAANDATNQLTAITRTGAVGTWDTETWAFELRMEESDFSRLDYHPAGHYAVTSDETGAIQVRDAETLEPQGDPMVGHTAAVGVFGVAFAFFGDDYLVSLGQDQTLRLWDVETRTQIGDPLPTDGSAAFAIQPAQWLVGTATEDQFLLWNYNPGEWFDIACRAAGRNLTADEWNRFGPDGEPYQATCSQ